jgi:predicted Rossmann fold nucleotide-binding protein DprA/Smf involved in DNA uptake
VVRDAQDVLDALYGAGVRQAASERRAPIEPAASSLLRALAAGEDTAAALDQAGLAAEDGLAVLAELELGGHLRRGPGGRWLVMP